MSVFIKIFLRYGFLGTLRLIRDLIFSRLIHPGVRLIRLPSYVRGGRYIDFGSNFTSGVGLRVDALGAGRKQIVFGQNVQVGDYVHVAAVSSVIFGDNVLIASKVYISDHDHGVYSGDISSHTSTDEVQIDRALSVASVHIQDNVWIGEGVSILKGVVIGRNSIIGACSVVTKSVPADCIAVGNPARIIKRYNYELACWVGVEGI